MMGTKKLFCYNNSKKTIGVALSLQFEWDDKKANINRVKHGISLSNQKRAKIL